VVNSFTWRSRRVGTYRVSHAYHSSAMKGLTIRPIRFPLSVFVVSDMLELAQAHASYRFSIADESTSQIKLLIWLFNPSVRISYRRIMPYNPCPTQSSRRRSIASIKSRRSSTTSIASTGIQVMGPESKRTSKIMYKILNDGDSYVPLRLTKRRS
jgi:hypothetical protein